VIECTFIVDHGVLGAVTVLSIHPLHPPLHREEQGRKICEGSYGGCALLPIGGRNRAV
jgi:hypothetical protein